MPPNVGGPPAGPDPQEPEDRDSQQSGSQDPHQYPSEPSPQQPPPGGTTPPDQPRYYPPGQEPPQSAPGDTNIQYPPQGGGPQYAGEQPPMPPGGYPYPWAPQGPPPPHRTGLIVGIVIAVGVLLLGGIGLVALNTMRDTSSDSAAESESGADSHSPDSTTELPTTEPDADSAVGSCLPFVPVINATEVDLSTPCDSADAFWKVTNANGSTNAAVDANGYLVDVQIMYDLCGAEYGMFELGKPWTTWYLTYDSTTSTVADLYCFEAVGNPDSTGRLPITPDVGSCFDDSETWWTLPCESEGAKYVVLDAITFDKPKAMTDDEMKDASASCSGGARYWPLLDVEGRTTAILCGDETGRA